MGCLENLKNMFSTDQENAALESKLNRGWQGLNWANKTKKCISTYQENTAFKLKPGDRARLISEAPVDKAKKTRPLDGTPNIASWSLC